MADNSKVAGPESFRGTVAVPGVDGVQNVSVSLDTVGKTAVVRFDSPVAGSDEWQGVDVQMAPRLKYHEVVFATQGLPKDRVELTWKLNVSGLDNTVAGVIVVKPNDQKVTGEKGFILTRVDE